MTLSGLARTRRAVWTLTQRRGKATAQAQAQAHTQALGGATASSSSSVRSQNDALSGNAVGADEEERSQRLLRRNTSIPGFSPSELIVKKRNGRRLSREEIDWFIQGFHRGDIEDYQMSALLMTIAIKGMSNQEASDLTLSMVRTGSTANLASIRPDMPKIDKHSTGGVGDSTSLILAPLMASMGVVVPILSGRTLGHTGGTLDKIDSIPGCHTTLSNEEFMEVLERTGAAFASPDATGFAPVDSSIYSLRDVSGSVDSIALVASSVMSKKLAANPDALLLDVKRGRGAFFNNLNDTASLASMMCSIGEDAGIHTMALITCMDHVLGGSVGNWLEVQEAVRILAASKHDVGADPRFETSDEALSDLRDLALSEAAVMLGLAGKAGSFREGFEMARDKLETGAGLDKLAEIVAAQDGDPRVLFNLSAATPPLYTQTLYAEEDVVIQDVNARDIGNAATLLGAGRTFAGDAIDAHAGICIHAKVGEVVRRGEPVFTAMVRDPTVTPPSGNPDTDYLFLGGEREYRLRLSRGFDLACRGVVLAQNRPENHVQPAPLIEYLVDARGVQPFKNL
ncbi:Thymidine phosphorylase [Hondaea fermentalgiana]|uniref:Thymidine phosphorylase n=1 Tax=Hondaea fermentalgiana TaxID=2315210 RepID=A0A2R5G5E7_9STRA|nr:Thymidine phosphorylase [Hondaea fermentalgiana]|eukprot:GBG25765.1 Thymidine phosphorylase [Hondaea fermentalgiana]